METIQFYVNVKIQKYNSFENIIKLINLIDENVIGKEIIFETNYIIKWLRTDNPQFDYKCIVYLAKKVNLLDEKVNLLDEKVNLLDEKVNLLDEKINNYVKVKFQQIQNNIKFNHDKFGTDWLINFVINK